MTKHTPGPWRVGGHPRDDSGTAWREILTDALPFAPSYVCQAQVRDAALIAAAPAMLAALEHLAAIAGTGLLHRASLDKQGMVELLAQARVAATRAIAEATGVPHVPTSADAAASEVDPVGLEADVAKAEASFLPPEPAFDPAKVRIVRKRFSTTQGEVEVFYDGRRLEQWGDHIVMRDDGEFHGEPDAFWIEVARSKIEGTYTGS